MDGVAGREFSAGGVPSLDKTIVDVSKTVQDPGGGSIYSAWTGDAAAPTIDRLGSGSDYTVFLDHLGAPSMEVGYSTPGGEYHSAYDDTYQVEHFLDPGYLGPPGGVAHERRDRAAARERRRAAVPLLGLRAAAVDGYVAELQEIQRTKPQAASGRPEAAARRGRRRGARRRWRSRRAPRPRQRRLAAVEGSCGKVNRALDAAGASADDRRRASPDARGSGTRSTPPGSTPATRRSSCRGSATRWTRATRDGDARTATCCSTRCGVRRPRRRGRRTQRRLGGGEAPIRHPIDRCGCGGGATERPGLGERHPGSLSATRRVG